MPVLHMDYGTNCIDEAARSVYYEHKVYTEKTIDRKDNCNLATDNEIE